MKGEQGYERFARSLAAPVSRRRALRTLGAAAVASAVPAWWPSQARAAQCDPATQLDCWYVFDRGWCCPLGRYVCGTPYGERCIHEPCGEGESECGITCCPAGSTCRDAPSGAIQDRYCESKCKGVICGDDCCLRDEECVEGRCIKRCPPGRTRCGGRCCGKGQRCVDGECRKCGKGQRACGSRCCPKGQDCCTDDAGHAVCCDTRRRSCCAVGAAAGRRRMTCCPPKTHCARLMDITATGTAVAAPRDADQLCCPPKRYVSGPGVCCPPGHVSLGGKLVLPAGGGGGLCCREDKVCGSGKSVTCCGSGGPGTPEFEQWCVNGRCQGRPA